MTERAAHRLRSTSRLGPYRWLRFVVAEEREDGILIRPATVLPVEVYTPERKAEFLLNNAVDPADYREARAKVKRLGVDPDRIKHRRPRRRG
jgi:hypothetical protein